MANDHRWGHGHQYSPVDNENLGRRQRHHTGHAGYDARDDQESRLESLRAQVGSLRSVTIEINEEARQQNAFLDAMGHDLENASGALGKAMKQLKRLARSEKGRSYLCYTCMLALFVFIVFFFKMLF